MHPCLEFSFSGCIRYLNNASQIQLSPLGMHRFQKVQIPHGNLDIKLFHKLLNMSFLCDGIIKYKNKYYILELKTESSNKFWQRQDTDPVHYNQATAYSLAFGIDNVIFVYICRDNLEMKSYMFTPTSDMKNSLVGYIDECNSYVSRQVVPPKPEPLNKKACMYCRYKKYCKEDS